MAQDRSLDDMVIFSADEDNRVPGELVVKLTEDGQRSVAASIPSGPITRLAGPLPTSFGIDNLDRVLGDLKVTSVTRVHAVVSSLAFDTAEAGTLAADVNATYRLRLADAGADLAAAARRLERLGNVVEASPNYFRYAQVVPNDPQFGAQWGLTKINCPAAWQRTKGSASVVVAVVDSGVDLDHPDLQAQLLPGFDMVDLAGVTPRPGFRFEGDFMTRDTTPQDEVGHGTHVAGTIAAVTNNAAGVAGVTWFCKILPVKVLARLVRISDGRVTGSGTAVDVAAGIRWAADHGAHIINLSLGSASATFVERDAVAYAIARGVTVVAAMGNENTSAPSFPAAYPNVIAVGATDQTDRRASFSNMGAHIAVSAPGVGIRSTDWDNGFSDKSGTSMATPHVAGVAALLKSCNSSLTPAQIAQILKDTARPLRDAPSDPVPNNNYGHGLIDARAAIDRACPKPPTEDIKLKFRDDPITIKATDDPKRKVIDDPKLKVADDPVGKRKIFDDPITIKAIDDPKLKFADDPKRKVIDDPKFKFADDPVGKPPAADGPVPPIRQPGRPPAPFVLATPHHSMAWAGLDPAGYASMLAEYEAAIAQYEAVLSQAQGAQAGGADAGQIEALFQQYQQLVAEYQQMAQSGAAGGGQPGGPGGVQPSKLKFPDDGPTINKAVDDGGTPNKFADDNIGTANKFLDDRATAVKFIDDRGTPIKFLDDRGTPVKFIDDRGTPIKFVDDRATPNKLVDDVGTPNKLTDVGPRPPVGPTAAGDVSGMLGQIEAMLAEYEALLAQYAHAYDQGQLTMAEYQQFVALDQEHQALMAEYQRLSQGG